VVGRLGALAAAGDLGLISKRRTLAGFVALGLFWGAWAAVLPDVQRGVGASKGALGVALLFVAVGSVPAMLLIAGPAVERFGGRAVAWACAAFALAAALPGLATSLPALAAALVLTGAASGVLDVGINAQAARIESESGRRLMPLAHGLYSTGVLAGAVTGGLARNAGSGREPILVAVGVLIALTAVLLGRHPAPPIKGTSRRARLERTLLVIGLLGAAAFVVEGAIENWSAIFLERQLDAEPAVSGLGPGVFGASMAAGRFFGQAAGRLSDRVLLTAGTTGAAAGCAVVASAPDAAIALVGFAVAGGGISLNAPVIFGAAGRRRTDPAAAVATVTTLAYLGFFIGPPLFGGLAQASGLRTAFAVLTVIAAGVAVAATRLRTDERPEPRSQTTS
jgi:MFS family permease